MSKKRKPCKPKPKEVVIWDEHYSKFLRDFFANPAQVLTPVIIK